MLGLVVGDTESFLALGGHLLLHRVGEGLANVLLGEGQTAQLAGHFAGHTVCRALVVGELGIDRGHGVRLVAAGDGEREFTRAHIAPGQRLGDGQGTLIAVPSAGRVVIGELATIAVDICDVGSQLAVLVGVGHLNGHLAGVPVVGDALLVARSLRHIKDIRAGLGDGDVAKVESDNLILLATAHRGGDALTGLVVERHHAALQSSLSGVISTHQREVERLAFLHIAPGQRLGAVDSGIAGERQRFGLIRISKFNLCSIVVVHNHGRNNALVVNRNGDLDGMGSTVVGHTVLNILTISGGNGLGHRLPRTVNVNNLNHFVRIGLPNHSCGKLNVGNEDTRLLGIACQIAQNDRTVSLGRYILRHGCLGGIVPNSLETEMEHISGQRVSTGIIGVDLARLRSPVVHLGIKRVGEHRKLGQSRLLHLRAAIKVGLLNLDVRRHRAITLVGKVDGNPIHGTRIAHTGNTVLTLGRTLLNGVRIRTGLRKGDVLEVELHLLVCLRGTALDGDLGLVAIGNIGAGKHEGEAVGFQPIARGQHLGAVEVFRTRQREFLDAVLVGERCLGGFAGDDGAGRAIGSGLLEALRHSFSVRIFGHDVARTRRQTDDLQSLIGFQGEGRAVFDCESRTNRVAVLAVNLRAIFTIGVCQIDSEREARIFRGRYALGALHLLGHFERAGDVHRQLAVVAQRSGDEARRR